MRIPKRASILGVAILTLVSLFAAAFVTYSNKAHASTGPQAISDAQLQAMTTTMGGADVLPTTRTIPHWWGSTLDPSNGVTYGYNMVGANPNTCSGSGC